MSRNLDEAIQTRLRCAPPKEIPSDGPTMITSLIPQTRKSGIRFTERLTGHFSQHTLTDFASAERQGRKDGSTLELHLSLSTEDLDRLLTDENHAVRVTGTVLAPSLSAAPMPIREGTFHAFVLDHDQVAAREMRYRLIARSQEGRSYFLRGHKFIHSDSVLHLWSETTTLYVAIHEGMSAADRLVGRGAVHASPDDFARQCRTVEITHADDDSQCLTDLVRFGRFLLGGLYDSYGHVAAGPHAFHAAAAPRRKRALRLIAPEVHFFPTSDGLHLRLTRYRAGTRGPVLLVPGLGVSSRIFALDTIDTNLLEFLGDRGYDVWLLDPRSSIDLPYAEQPYTVDDLATKDLPAAVAEVRWKTGAADVQCVAHCLGATAFTRAMLAGMKGVRSAVLSQQAAHVVAPSLTHAGAGAHLPEILDRVPAVHNDDEPWHEQLENVLLSAYPVIVGLGDSNPVSRRLSFLYGQVFEVAQLNETTYWDALHEVFGRTSLRCLEHLAAMVRAGSIVNADGRDVTVSHAHRLALPLLLVHGAKNRSWLPEGTRLTYDWLCRENGPAQCRREVIADYGHHDCIIGRNAVRDVYPHILEHLERTAR